MGRDMRELQLSNRVLGMKPSATLGMAQTARELADSGVDVVVLSAGEPDFCTPKSICEVAKRSIDKGNTHYVPVRGTKTMVKAMREKFRRDQKVEYGDDEVMCTVGAKSAILLALEAVLNPGDEVVIFAPYWVSYLEQIRLAYGVPIVVECSKENDFLPTGEQLANAITPKTRAVILNSPNNPSGGVIKKDQLEGLARVLGGTNIWLISDEIYEKIIYDGHEHFCPASLSDDMRHRTIVISGASKGYAMTGWRVGVVGGPKRVITSMTKLQGQETTCLPGFIQDAAAFALEEDQQVRSDMKMMLNAYRDRRDHALTLFGALANVNVFKPAGAFYIWADFSYYVGRGLGGHIIENDIDLATRMLKEAHVASVPGSPFGGKGYIRLSTASAKKAIEMAAHRIEQWLALAE